MDTQRKSDCALRPIVVVGSFTPYFGGQIPNEVYLANALERRGHEVHRFQRHGTGLQQTIPGNSIAIFAGPHVGGLAPTAVKGGAITVFWTLDAPDAFNRRARFEVVAKNCHAVFASADWGLRGFSKELPFLRLPAAVPDEVYAFAPNPKLSVAFCGTLYSDRRREIANIVAGYGGEVRTHERYKVFGQELADLCQSTKIMVGDNWTNDHEGYWSSRNYIIPGSGGFLLTAHVPGIEKEFQVGSHLVTWRTTRELYEKIGLFLKMNSEREMIRKEGFEYTRRAHTWDDRAKTVESALEVLCASS